MTAERTSTPTGPAPAVLVAVVVGVAAGVLAGIWTPRGPISSAEALGSMAVSLLAGGATGALTGRRWSMLVTPLAFVATFEAVRAGASGPTVDGIVLSNPYGVVAFLTGRGVHGLVALAPMALGAALGRSWRLRRAGATAAAPPRSAAGRVATVLAGSLLVVLAVAFLRPAWTDPIVGPDGEPLDGSVATVERVRIDGHDQTLLIRGNDADAPVLLFLAGGPGGSELGTMRRWGSLLEQDFVVVTWDQLGAGSSSGQFDPAAVLTFAGAVQDTIAVTEHLLDRFDREQVYLVGNSYGSLLGVRAAVERPDLYAAFVGTGQMVDVVETDQRFYEAALAHAETTGNEGLAATLEANGPPPYEDLLDMAPIVASERDWNDYRDIDGFPGLREPSEYLLSTEYAFGDQLHTMGALVDTYVALYPQLEEVDLRQDATRLEVPLYLVQGAHEAPGRADLAAAWFDQVAAPHKEWIELERSGHRPWVQEPERFHEVMRDVLADTAGAPGEGTPAGDGPDSELLALFERYDPAVWPAHLVAYALAAVLVVALWRRPGPDTDRLVAVVLAVLWTWMGVVFQGRYAATVSPLAGALYGALFLLQAGLLVRAGLVRRDLSFSPRGGWAPAGWAVLAFALVVYPVLGVALGHGWPALPLFGTAPCPTTIATFGFFLLARPPLPRGLVWVPLVWAVLAPPAAMSQGVGQDAALLVVGVAATAALLWRNRRGRRPDGGTSGPAVDDGRAGPDPDGRRATDPVARPTESVGV